MEGERRGRGIIEREGEEEEEEERDCFLIIQKVVTHIKDHLLLHHVAVTTAAAVLSTLHYPKLKPVIGSLGPSRQSSLPKKPSNERAKAHTSNRFVAPINVSFDSKRVKIK